MANYGTILVVERGQGTGHCPDRNTQHLLKTTSISAFFFQNPYTIQINALPLQQHTYPASRKNSALRVSLFFYEHDITILQPAAYYGWRANTTLEVWGFVIWERESCKTLVEPQKNSSVQRWVLLFVVAFSYQSSRFIKLLMLLGY